VALSGFIAVAILGPGSASAVAPDPNPWLTKRFLHIAHQGGEDEAPSNTLYAFKSAIAERGADMLELDVNLTSDNELMVIHDDTWTRTACTDAICTAPAAEPMREESEVNNKTLAELKELDAGYWFRPGTYSHDYSPTAVYPFRGIATGDVPPPAGYTANDFTIPTLREVLDAFPNTPINIEIKMIKTVPGTTPGTGCDSDEPTYCDDHAGSIPVATALADLLDEPQYASRDDIIVVSFSDLLINEFQADDDPPQVALAPATAGVLSYITTGLPPTPDVAAFQVPPSQGFDVPSLLLEFPRDAHADGYAVHVWPNGEEPESEASYARLYAMGVDGYMSSKPSRLHAWLCAQAIPRPDGTARGPECVKPSTAASVTPASPRKCKKGKKLKRGKCVKKKRKKKKKRKRRR
jgi:glycerophosphoryl diester phosphodiesterase